MPNIKSAIKRVNTNQTNREANIAQKNAMRTAIKRANSAKQTNAENKDELLRYAVKQVDKASQKNLIHQNKASRMKSQLMTN